MSGFAAGIAEPTVAPPAPATKAKSPWWRNAAWWKNAGQGLWRRAKALVFVVAAFAFWFLFVSLAKFVMRCEVTLWWALLPEYRCAPTNLGSITQDGGWPDTIILMTTLVIGIWAARRLVFPPED